MSALLSFLGGSVFRMLWGEVAAYLTKRQDHKHELELLELQARLQAATHAQNLEGIRVQAEMGVKTIVAQAEADIGKIEADGWLSAVQATGRVIGIAWIDGWNAVIRPGVATWAVVMLTCGELSGVALSDAVLSVCSAALGIYLAERNLMKRGK